MLYLRYSDLHDHAFSMLGRHLQLAHVEIVLPFKEQSQDEHCRQYTSEHGSGNRQNIQMRTYIASKIGLLFHICMSSAPAAPANVELYYTPIPLFSFDSLCSHHADEMRKIQISPNGAAAGGSTSDSKSGGSTGKALLAILSSSLTQVLQLSVTSSCPRRPHPQLSLYSYFSVPRFFDSNIRQVGSFLFIFSIFFLFRPDGQIASRPVSKSEDSKRHVHRMPSNTSRVASVLVYLEGGIAHRGALFPTRQ